MQIPPPHTRFAFGEYELNEACFELRLSGQRVPVQPKVLRLLMLLVNHRHRALSADELMARLWPTETVGRGSIKRAIRGARKALNAPDCIRTVRGYGYQFALPVQTPSS